MNITRGFLAVSALMLTSCAGNGNTLSCSGTTLDELRADRHNTLSSPLVIDKQTLAYIEGRYDFAKPSAQWRKEKELLQDGDEMYWVEYRDDDFYRGTFYFFRHGCSVVEIQWVVS
jgi:hypothetical protein